MASERPRLLGLPGGLGWLLATVLATASMGTFYCTELFLLWMGWGVLTALISMPSTMAKPPAAIAIAIRVACVIPALEAYNIVRRMSAEPPSLALCGALWAHAINLVAAIVVVELVAASSVRAWAGLRAFLGIIACNGVCSVALIHFAVGDGLYPAPGGTSTSPASLLACSFVAMTIAMAITPPARMRALEAYDAACEAAGEADALIFRSWSAKGGHGISRR